MHASDQATKEDVARLEAELREALQQQAATADVLKVISRSAFDLPSVLQTLVDSAIRLCGADMGAITLREGASLRFMAGAGHSPELRAYETDHPHPIARGSFQGRAALEGRTVHVPDVLDDAEYERLEAARIGGFRAVLSVPLLRDTETIGVFGLARRTPGSFAPRQIRLVESFADQAVIAIENVRLFAQAQSRNQELAEALEQQVATSAILRVIAASPTDIQPVLDAVTESAARLCDAHDATLFLRRDETLPVAARYGEGIPVDFTELPMDRGVVTARAVLDRAPVHIHDLLAAGEEFAAGREYARRLGFRSILAAPLLREGEAIGALMIRRKEVRPFSDKQIELLKTFTDQAVIAIENVRLFEEVQTRTADLSEALQQQTTTAEVLKVISRSAFDLQAVLDTLVASAAKLCGSTYGGIYLRDGDVLRARATIGASAEEAAEVTDLPIRFDRSTVSGRAALSRCVEHIPDVLADADYHFPSLRKHTQIRALMAAPLLREGEVDGVFFLGSTQAGSFTSRHSELLQTFADQAVIAIENVRLFDEVQAKSSDLAEALQQQTATADVLKVISRSAFDLKTVLNTLAGSASRLCDADIVDFYRLAGDEFEWAASFNRDGVEEGDHTTIRRRPGRGSASGRVLLERKTVHIPDFEADPEFTFVDVARKRGVRCILGAPLLREDTLVGLLLVLRKAPAPFTLKQIELAETFADQAVIAIENVRLFDEVQARTRELQESLEYQTATSDVLNVISRSPSQLQPVFDEIVATAARLCQAEYASVWMFEGPTARLAATTSSDPEFVNYQRRHPLALDATSIVARVAAERRTLHVRDVLADPEHKDRERQRVGGYRTVLCVPLLRNGEPIGTINLVHNTVRPFSERQIELVQTFADQAVIAIENVRLFDEVQARNREVTEALERQTATGEILGVIARSPTDVQPVFDTIAKSAARLCEAKVCGVFRFDGALLRYEAQHGLTPEGYEAVRGAYPMLPGRGSAAARAVLSGDVEQIPDVDHDPDYELGLAGTMEFHSTMSVPMLRDRVPIGAISVGRIETGHFPERQVELLKTFADQAVIAIENVRLFEEVQARNRALTESLEQQTAMSEILRVISRSPTDVQPVFETISESAARLCQANFCAVFRFDGELIHFMAQHGMSAEAAELQRRAFPSAPGRTSAAARAILNGRVEQIPDVEADPSFALGTLTKKMGARSVISVPMLRDGRPVGAINIARSEAGHFPDRQVELLKTFADQAVIAIENARLFEEVQARTAELTEALRQQTATADVLKVISRSAFDLQTVLNTLAESVAQLCEADMVSVNRQIGTEFYGVANYGFPPEFDAYIKTYPHTPGRGTTAGRVLLEGKAVQIPDVLEDTDYAMLEGQRLGGFRTSLGVPLLREGRPIGVIVLTRSEVRPFTDKQIELVTTFADQAVIAIENVRLFDEVQARSAELAEALQQQTATADVLKVISRSAFDLRSVLQILVESAVRLCEADKGMITRLKDGKFFHAEAYGFSPEFIEYYFRTIPVEPGRGTVTGRALLEGKIIHVPDVQADEEYTWSEGQRLGGFRTLVGVPMLREGIPVGVMALTRSEARPFTEKQIELVQTFADQAVIAIENVRLFEEVQARTADLSEALRQQTATADVLKVISRSTFDLQGVLDALAETATRVCEADKGAIMRRDGEVYRFAANAGFSPETVAYATSHTLQAGPGSATSRAASQKQTIHIPDVLDDPSYTASAFQSLGGYRTMLAVPLLREGAPIGVFILSRVAVSPFTQKQIELVETFADQAVIAIENVRLFDEVQARTEELSEALQQQTATADVLKVISRSAFDLNSVLQTLINSACKLCGSDTGGIYMQDGDLYRLAANYGMTPQMVGYEASHPNRVGRDSYVGRTVLERDVVHVPDVSKDLEYGFPELPDLGGFKAVLSVPLMREGLSIGVFSMGRAEPGPFSQRQIELVQTFADQAVIAIENVRLFEEVRARTEELSEALQQQTATSEVLRVISSSPTDIRPVLDAVGANAARLCEANNAVIFRLEGGVLRHVASYGGFPTTTHPSEGLPLNRDTVSGRAVFERRTVHVHDLAAEETEYPQGSRHAKIDGHRTTLATPLLREGEPLGAILIRRMEVRPFSPKQIELVTTFANQAAIAIENVRLFEEAQARTAELSEALEQQTATSDVLKVISRSTFDLQVVLDTLVESAVRLCRADKGGIVRSFDGVMRYVATFGYPDSVRAYLIADPPAPGRGSAVGRVVEERRIVQIEDVAQDPDYRMTAVAKAGGIRTVLAVPLMRESELIGVFAMTRADVRRFNEKEIELVKTFADQAVIAIENVRLFEEVQAKTRDLEEALTFQKATGDVLEVIGRSASNLDPVLEAIVDTAADLCHADMSVVRLLRDGALHYAAASKRNDPAIVAHSQENPIVPTDRSSVAGRVALEGRTIHVADISADPEYNYLSPLVGAEVHSILGVPLFQNKQVIGVIALLRRDINPFTDRQIALVETLADQAVIAIENVRLFEEVQARTRELSRSLQDLRTAQDRLIQTEKLASLGQLTAGIAHEIKNPLNFVNNFSALSAELVEELREALNAAGMNDRAQAEIDEIADLLKGNLEKVVQHGKRADSIVKNMLLHSRQGSGDRRPVDINAIVEESLNLAYHGARAERQGFNVTIEKSLDPDAGEVDLYPQEITRVLLNLISNGFYATSKRKAASDGVPYEPTLSAATKSLGDSIEIRIRDNGTGISTDVKEKMFNPFFTTKPAGEGTGLGLSLSHDIIVKQHAGAIEVDTVPGQFTEFRIVLPRAGGAPGEPGGSA